jgi:acetyl-CoA acetyltransferase
MRDATCIVGVGTTAYGRRGEFFDRSQVEQIREALDQALAESGIDRREIDGFSSYSGDRNEPSLLAPALGIPEVNFSSMVFGGGGGGTCAAIANAAAAIVAGMAEVVMVYKVITQPPHARFGAAYGLATVADPYADFHRPFGLIAPAQFFALLFRRHMQRYGTTPLHLAEVAVATRAHALRNPKALMRTPLTVAEHQRARLIADPFRLYDCCQENDGGAVILVTSAERAQHLRQRPVHILAAAQGGDSA